MSHLILKFLNSYAMHNLKGTLFIAKSFISNSSSSSVVIRLACPISCTKFSGPTQTFVGQVVRAGSTRVRKRPLPILAFLPHSLWAFARPLKNVIIIVVVTVADS